MDSVKLKNSISGNSSGYRLRGVKDVLKKFEEKDNKKDVLINKFVLFFVSFFRI